MSKCTICGKTTDGAPHTVCARCGSNLCDPCAPDRKRCPVCGYEG